MWTQVGTGFIRFAYNHNKLQSLKSTVELNSFFDQPAGSSCLWNILSLAPLRFFVLNVTGILLIFFASSLSLVTPGAALYQPLTLQSPDSADVTKNGHQRARVLYDYDAKDATELSLMADEVTPSTIYNCTRGFSSDVTFALCAGILELKCILRPSVIRNIIVHTLQTGTEMVL
jgi:hypothetical protein